MIIGQYPVVTPYISASGRLLLQGLNIVSLRLCPSQSAFVQGRSIADNVLITQDLMINYHSDKGPPRCALKIDIKKAYDTIGWGFQYGYPRLPSEMY